MIQRVSVYVLLLSALMAACSETVVGETVPSVPPPAFHGSDVRGEVLGGDFSLTDQYGRTVGLNDFKGKVTALVFGFTHCPDVCPTHLLNYAQAVGQLSPAEAENVRVVFVSLDPQRDRPELLQAYLAAFDPRFVGLTTADGSEEAVAEMMRLFGVSAEKLPARDDGFYFVEHSTTTFMLDRRGQVVVAAPLGLTAAELAADLRLLVQMD